MEPYSLYALQLTENKWFITLSNKTLASIPLTALQDDYELVYDFIKEAPIVSVKKLEHNVTDSGAINASVKQYMKTYGIQNVRGGCYTDAILPETTIALLECELNYTIESAVAEMNMLYEVKGEYAKSVALEEEIRQILLKVAQIKEQIRNFIKCETVKLDYDRAQYVGLTARLAQYKQITPSTIEDIEWLLDSVYNPENIRNHSYNKVRYANIVYEQLPLLTKIFMSIVEDPDEYRIDGVKYTQLDHLYNPNLVLDKMFLLRGHDATATKLLQYFEYMAYVILNRIMELEFDVGCYGPNYEKKHSISKALVKRMNG
jgi:hypothetical protein